MVLERRPKTYGMDPERSRSMARTLWLRQGLSALTFVALGVAAYFLFLNPSLQCRHQRTRDEALALAFDFARDAFEGQARVYKTNQLVERYAEYDEADGAWRVLVMSDDNYCAVSLYIKDCTTPRLAASDSACEGGIVEIPLTPLSQVVED